MAAPRRLDIHVDFVFKQRGGNGGNAEANIKAMSDVQKYIKWRLGRLEHITVQSVTTERADEQRVKTQR